MNNDMYELIFSIDEMYNEEQKSIKVFNENFNNGIEKLIKDYFKNPKYIELCKKINGQNSISKINIPYINYIDESKKDILINIGEASISYDQKSIEFWNKLRKIKDNNEKQQLIRDFFSDIDKKYNDFINKIKTDYNIIEIKIKKIFNFKMEKLDLSWINNGYKNLKKYLKNSDIHSGVIERYYFSFWFTKYNVIIDRKIYDQMKQANKEKEDKKYNKIQNKQKKIDNDKIQQIHIIYDLFIDWINNPKMLSGYSDLSMYDIISIYVLFNKPISDLCNRCKRGRFDKLYSIDWAKSEEYNNYFSKAVIDNCGNKSKLIEHNGENDFVYNPLNNKIFYISYEHEELVSDFNNWDLLYVTDMFNGNVEISDIKQIIEEYDKEKGYNFV